MQHALHSDTVAEGQCYRVRKVPTALKRWEKGLRGRTQLSISSALEHYWSSLGLSVRDLPRHQGPTKARPSSPAVAEVTFAAIRPHGM